MTSSKYLQQTTLEETKVEETLQRHPISTG